VGGSLELPPHCATPFAVEQLTWSFLDMTSTGGRMAMMWGRTLASTPFKASN